MHAKKVGAAVFREMSRDRQWTMTLSGDYFALRMNTRVVLWRTAAVYCFIKGQQTISRLSEQYCLGHTSFAESQ